MKLLKTVKIGLLLGFLVTGKVQGQDTHPSSRPVFQVDYAYPTADKPQSKLWYAGSSWWALLPRSSGPSLWQRTGNGWKELPEVNRTLRGVPGRADVWVDKDGVTAVGVSADSLVVFCLKGGEDGWKGRVLATLKPPVKEDIETATIVRDSRGEWWVAADGNTSIYSFHSGDGKTWSRAILLKEGVSKDDICVITALPGAVMVTWSNQKEEAVQYRLHKDGHAEAEWEKQGIVEAGNKTADDHLHTALASDGRVWMVSKNSVDSNGYPQLVLRIRQPGGVWSNFPYAPRTAQAEPSRPVIVATPRPGLLFEAHTIYDKTDRYRDRIELSRIDTSMAGLLQDRRIVIEPAAELKSKVNDCTVAKFAYPAGVPWIILASDAEGRVYEAEIEK